MKKKPKPYLKVSAKTRRLLIRPYKLTDFAVCVQSHKNRLPKLNDFDDEIPTSKSKTYAEFKKRIENHRKHGKMKVHFIFGVFDKKSRSLIGQIDFFTINAQLNWANLGYHFQNQYWGKGYASEACRKALRMAFDDLCFYRVEAATELKNKTAIKVAENIGMAFEGTRVKFFPDNGGIDMVVYGANAIDYR